MGEHTKIEWCDHSLSPWWGCTKVSPGCAFCYAEGLDARWHGGRHWGKGAPRMRQPNFERNALALNRKAAKRGHRVTVFPSMCDPFDAEVPAEWLAHFFDVVRRTPHLTWILVTKRPENWERVTGAACAWMSPLGPYAETKRWLFEWLGGWERENGRAPANVWVLTSVEDQARANLRIPALRKIPAVVRGLSVEPMLGAIDLFTAETIGRDVTASDTRQPGDAWLDWVICGGESGPAARPMHPEWARELREQCAANRVPFFFKQWGEWLPEQPAHANAGFTHGTVRYRFLRYDGQSADYEDYTPELNDPRAWWMARVGKAEAGRALDGEEHSNFPDLTKTEQPAP